MDTEGRLADGERQGDLVLAVVLGRPLDGAAVQLADLSWAKAPDGRVRVMARGAAAPDVAARLLAEAATHILVVDEFPWNAGADDSSAAVLVVDPATPTDHGIRVVASIMIRAHGRDIALQTVAVEFARDVPGRLIGGPTVSAS